MKKKNSGKKGQFSIIAALLVAVVLVTALITTYSLVRYSPFSGSPQVLGAVDEINLALKRTLEFTIGYYGSILQVTSNVTYAKSLAANYLYSGLVYITRMHPEWSPSFLYNSSNVATNWFMPSSYSYGNLSVVYSLPGLGISNISYSTSSELNVKFLSANATETRISVTEENGLPVLTLLPQAFSFYSYNYANLAWTTVHPSSATPFGNGTYVVSIPAGVDYTSYLVQITDPRGIMVTLSRLPYYTYTLAWNASLYSTLNNDVIVVEALQNGSLRWLGQNLKLTTQGRPLPPISVRSLHINQTINGMNREVPFQVEDWGSNYKVPLGLSSNMSVFSSKNMMVFLVTHKTANVRIWWDGRDTAVQPLYAITNRYFTGDNVNNPDNGILTNGILSLTIQRVSEYGVGNIFKITSNVVGSTVTAAARFMRVNGQNATYGSGTAYVIHHGIVRDIVQQEAEWSGGVPNSPNFYTQLVVTLPANATYYTYAVRTIFVNSSQSRALSDLSIIRFSMSYPYSGGWGTTYAEDGPFPPQTISNTVTLFYNSTTKWAHHWSEFLSTNKGGGIMYTNASNFRLYAFDNATAKTGALSVADSRIGSTQNVNIEVDPIKRYTMYFKTARDITWYGAVVNFDGTDPIYSSSGNVGLWAIIEAPPTVAIS